MSERVFVVAPRGGDAIEDVAHLFLRAFQPEMLAERRELDLAHLVDKRLPPVGIDTYPAAPGELHDQAVTIPTPGRARGMTILLRHDVEDHFRCTRPARRRARATVAHELGHALLHEGDLRALQGKSQVELMMYRAERRNLAAYLDPEWQAWRLARAVLMPPEHVRAMRGGTVIQVARQFGVSEALAKRRIDKDLKLRIDRRSGRFY